jgi:hypothetical protein
MDLFLRKENHPQASDNYRVVVRDSGDEIEVGSISVQFDGWHWAIDSVVPMRDIDAEGRGQDRKDCQRQFRAAWNRFKRRSSSADGIFGDEAEAAAMSWSRPFDDPIALPRPHMLIHIRSRDVTAFTPFESICRTPKRG